VAHADGVRSSVVPAGLDNAGLVEESVLFPGVRVGAGARVRRSVVLPGAEVPAGADLDSCVVLEDGTVQRVAAQAGPGEDTAGRAAVAAEGERV
jgi:glucose-1-phosphate adenylyltransferase